MNYKEKGKRLILLIIWLLLIYAFLWFLNRHHTPMSFGFLMNIFTVFFVSLLYLKPDYIIGIKISEIKKPSTAKYYQSLIINTTIAFISVIGIGIAIIWGQYAKEYRFWVTVNLFLIALLIGLVMHSKFYSPLNDIIIREEGEK